MCLSYEMGQRDAVMTLQVKSRSFPVRMPQVRKSQNNFKNIVFQHESCTVHPDKYFLCGRKTNKPRKGVALVFLSSFVIKATSLLSNHGSRTDDQKVDFLI
jgi:hypothetical protein